MTIVFQGHVLSLSSESTPVGKLAVTLATPMAESNGRSWTIYVPTAQGPHWLPGRCVNFTLYAFDMPSARPDEL